MGSSMFDDCARLSAGQFILSLAFIFELRFVTCGILIALILLFDIDPCKSNTKCSALIFEINLLQVVLSHLRPLD